jgi:hypothetical protein
VGDRIVFSEPDKQPSPSREARVTLESKSGRAILAELIVKVGNLKDVTTYSAALLIDYERIRGVDFSKIERTCFYKTKIPKGWHQNIVDPNTGDNRHEALVIDPVGDLDDFIRKVAKLWNISYSEEVTLL